MLVGRDAELRELEGAVAEALRTGRGWTALLTGEPGIGKTTLAAELAARTRAAGVATAWAACRQEGGTPPYWPWAQLLRRLGRAEALAVPEGDAELARFLLFDAVGAALRAAAPVLLVLDDLHWADPDSLRLLAALGAHVGEAPVLVLGTYRDTEPGGAAGLAADRRIGLAGLAAADLGAALRATTGEDVDDGATAALHRRTGGNPFFAAEIVRMLRGRHTADTADTAGSADEAGTALPSGVRAVLERRLGLLDEPVPRILRAAAVLDAGTTAGVDAVLLAAVADVPVGVPAGALAAAVEARLVVAHEGRHRFPHALVAETLRALTPPAEALVLHRRAATALAARLDAAVGVPAELARHRVAVAGLSGQPRERAEAAAAAVRAATAAPAAAAHGDALRWWETALAHLDVRGPAPDRGEVLCALGETALAAGDPERSRTAYREAGAYARRHDRPRLLAKAALGATGGTTGFEIDLRDPDRCALLEEALAAVPRDEPALHAALAARLSVALAFTGAESRRRALADEAVAGARRLGEPRVLAAALAARCDAIAGPGHVAERRAAADEIVACARRIPDRAVEVLGRGPGSVALAEAGRWAEVDVEIDGYAHVAEPLRQAGLSWCVPLWRGARALAVGDEEARRRHDAELAELVSRSRSGNAEILLLTQRFVAAVLRDRPEEADLDGFLRLAPELGPSGYATHALLRALAGGTGAGDLLGRWLDERGAGPHDSEWLPEAVQAAQAALLLGDRPAAARTYALLLPHAGLFAVEGMVAGTWGSVDAFLGRLAALLGDRAAARRRLAAAAGADARAGAALERRTRAWA
ncbi:ATP-binding protein, partial [Pseudonocardia lutea]